LLILVQGEAVNVDFRQLQDVFLMVTFVRRLVTGRGIG
jgi:hypothetical protein